MVRQLFNHKDTPIAVFVDAKDKNKPIAEHLS